MENNIFDQLAKKYDTEKQVELAKVITEEVKKELRNSESKNLLDYGSGTGLVGLELADYVKSLVLVDASEQMIEVIKNKASKKEITNTKVLLADFTEETPDIKVDIAFMSLVLLHIPDTKKILKELFNILNEDGKLIIVDFDKNDQVNHPKIHNGFSHDVLENLLSEVGFKNTDIRTFYSGKEIFAKQDATLFISVSKK